VDSPLARHELGLKTGPMGLVGATRHEFLNQNEPGFLSDQARKMLRLTSIEGSRIHFFYFCCEKL